MNNNLDRPGKLEKCGVYKVKCDDCQATYIGPTGKYFSTRLSEHIKTVKNDRILSNIADHS